MLRALVLSFAFAAILGLAQTNSLLVSTLEVYPLGPSAFWLTWKKPIDPEAELTGFNIYYRHIRGSFVGERHEYEPKITDPNVTSVKLIHLMPNTKYRISISATTKDGESDEYFVEQKTSMTDSRKPDVPSFTWEKIPSDDSNNDMVKIRIFWLPNTEGYGGALFFTEYRVKGNLEWHQTNQEDNFDNQIVADLKPDTVYEFRVVSVDGDYSTPSATLEIYTDKIPHETEITNLESSIDKVHI